METISPTINWSIETNTSVLQNIHASDINVVILQRDVSMLTSEIDSLLDQNIECRVSGDSDHILKQIEQVVDPTRYSLIINDIRNLLNEFAGLTNATEFRLMLASVSSNMCRRFHTDINDLRMLCTYSGPGTLWLTEDNVDRNALSSSEGNDRIVLNDEEIQQAETGSVVILKGAMYPQNGTKAAVHRSPTIEESGERRLLLRIDTNDSLHL